MIRSENLSLDPSPPAGRIALCVCAYNEEGIIRAKAENMLAMRGAVRNLDLLIYVDAASDRTAELLEGFADQIRVIVGVGRHGKTHGMNTLVAATDAEYVVFSDANVMFAPDAIVALLRPFQNPQIGCVCGHLVYTSGESNATASAGSAYWRLEETIKELESRTGSTMGADGSIFAIRRALHHEAPPDIIDDMFVSLSILCDGYRVVRADNAVAYEETVSRSREEFRRKTRIACQAFNVHRLLWPRLIRLSMLDRYKYVSHKLLRWLAIYWFGLAALCAMLGLNLMGHAGIAAALMLLGMMLGIAGLARPTGTPRKLIEVFLALVATGLGVLQSLRGKRFQVWTPPASARASKQAAR
jgi:cellulose synthase/poly-beta-1,6-N-acetylglucosamine synthase-like glycosyltransferase